MYRKGPIDVSKKTQLRCRLQRVTASLEVFCWRAFVVVQDTACGAGGMEFNSWSVQIGQSVVNRSPLLRRFFGGVLLWR